MSSQESRAPSQSQGASGKRRRRRSAPPPTRLSWPGTLSQSTTCTTSASQSQAKKSRSNSSGRSKNKRQKTLLQAFNKQDHNDDDRLLWVDQYAPSCRKELCVAPKKIQEVATWLEKGREKLLILVGRPGIGKSAMVRVLAQETNTEVLEWNDSYSTWSSHVESLSPLNSFTQFLQQSGVGYSSLDLQQQSAVATTTTPSFQKRLILLEELPNLHNGEAQDKFRQLLTNHVRNSQVKTIWIYSDGTEGQSKPADLERHVESNVLYAQSKILQINPATKAQIKKALERIAKAERFAVNKDFCERMHVQSGGDVRYAIMSLQFDQAGRGNGTDQPEHPRDTQWTAFHALGKILYAKREPADENTSMDSDERPPLKFDPEGVLEHCDLDLGHALTYLGFHSADFFTDIEELSTAFDLFSDASYLLEQTTNYNYQRRRYNNNTKTTVSCPIFPEGYVTSLAGRSMAFANRHPAESKFRQLQAPKIFEIRRKRTDNANHLAQLQHRLSRLSLAGDLATTAKASSSSMPSFVMDRLPYLRAIAPDAVSASLGQLHTAASQQNRFADPDDEAAAEEKLVQEQQEILQMDDIDDFDSSEEAEVPDRGAPQKPTNPYIHTQQNGSTEGANNRSNTAIDQRENDENRQQRVQAAKPTKPIKRIANPYLAKPPKTSSQQATFNDVRQPAATAVHSVDWSRHGSSNPGPPVVKAEVKSEPFPSARLSQPPVETKSKPVKKVVLMDV